MPPSVPLMHASHPLNPLRSYDEQSTPSQFFYPVRVVNHTHLDWGWATPPPALGRCNKPIPVLIFSVVCHWEHGTYFFMDFLAIFMDFFIPFFMAGAAAFFMDIILAILVVGDCLKII